MARKSYEELQQQISNDEAIVSIGSLWRHYKSGDVYKVMDLLVDESTDETGVSYSSVTHPQIKFFRPLLSFLEIVELDGEMLPRFTPEV